MIKQKDDKPKRKSIFMDKFETNSHSLQKNGFPNIPMVFVENGLLSTSDRGNIFKAKVSSFCIGKYPVTQLEWQDIMGYNPSFFTGEKRPVECVNWFEAIEFCNKLSLKTGLKPCYSKDGNSYFFHSETDGFRLPTETEWEFAGSLDSRRLITRWVGQPPDHSKE